MLVASCGVSRKGTSTSDVVVYHYVDSVMFHDSTIFVEVPMEVIKEVVPPYDTLKMETSLASSVSYVDTLTHTLKGSLENKTSPIETKIMWKEKVVYKDSIITKETVNEVEVPVPVKKIPKSYFALLLYFIASLIVSAAAMYYRFKNKLFK